MKLRLLLILSFTLLLAACGSNVEKNAQDEKLHIYTTVFPLYSMTKEIGGDTVVVESVYPKNVNVHSYEPSQKDTLKFAEGDLFIYVNDDLEPLAKKIKGTIGSHTETLASFKETDEIIEEDHAHEEHDEHNHGAHDPHVWLDPNLSLKMATEIVNKLSEMKPEHKELYQDNLKKLETDLKELDKELINITKNKKRDTVYISHESLGYLAHRYNFEQVGISGLNNEEPSQKELIKIVTHINEENIPYILYEQNVSSRVTDMIGRETSAEFLPFHNLESLTDKDPSDSTYQILMEKNIKSLNDALNK